MKNKLKILLIALFASSALAADQALEVNLTIPDAHVTRVATAFLDRYPQPEGVTIKAHFDNIAGAVLVAWLKDIVREYEGEIAKAAVNVDGVVS